MIDTERSLQSAARPHDEILRERAEGLHEAAQTAKARLAEREEALARLRAQVASLKAALKTDPLRHMPAPPPVRPVPARPAPMPVPAKEAPANSAIAKASIPRTAAGWPNTRTAAGWPNTRTARWRSLAPYATIAACAVLLEVGGARRPATAAPNFADLAQPAPAPVSGARPAAKGAPVVVDDDRSQEALLLVHEWRLPGDEKSLGERLGGEHELPGGRPAWRVERVAEHGYRVTFQPAPKDLPYAFEADIEARVVWPTPETQELLAPRFTAAFRDAAR